MTTSESSGCKSENEKQTQETSTESQSTGQAQTETRSPNELPTSLSQEEQDRFFWFASGVEIGVCAAAHLLKTEGRQELFLRVKHLLDTKDMQNLTAEMWWSMWLKWVENGSKQHDINFAEFTSTIVTDS